MQIDRAEGRQRVRGELVHDVHARGEVNHDVDPFKCSVPLRIGTDIADDPGVDVASGNRAAYGNAQSGARFLQEPAQRGADKAVCACYQNVHRFRTAG